VLIVIGLMRRTSQLVPRMALWLAVAVVAGASVSCAQVGERSDGGNRAAAHSEDARPSERPRRCPDARRPGHDPIAKVLDAVRAQVPAAYPSIDIGAYEVWSVFSLERDVIVVGLNRRRYLNVAARCGTKVARRSWVAVLSFPRAPDASFVPAVAYLARTREGWRLWYQWFPNKSERGSFPPP
jgi:hypothetical protein